MSSLWLAQFTDLLPGASPAGCTPPQFGTTTTEHGLVLLHLRKLFSTLVSTWKYASPAPFEPVSV